MVIKAFLAATECEMKSKIRRYNAADLPKAYRYKDLN
jgi:hypothetical protein